LSGTLTLDCSYNIFSTTNSFCTKICPNSVFYFILYPFTISLKFATENERETAYYDLIENDRVFEIDGIDRHISYIKGNNGLTLTINNF
ncbi:MAG: hypothetical protein IIT39_03890, partial [Clostridia bacterium]|nr:hypothetical protein [Clostridia bacterium]